MEPATESAVIVTVPPAEETVAHHRARLDPAAVWGVPAHVTVLYPFMPPSHIDSAVMERLTSAVASVPRFNATWPTTGWFGDEVLWLAPRPEDSFRALTAAVATSFPEFPPYGGEFDDLVPHLTVGHRAGAADLREVERRIKPSLPISMEVTAAALWCGSRTPGAWREVAGLQLGGGR